MRKVPSYTSLNKNGNGNGMRKSVSASALSDMSSSDNVHIHPSSSRTSLIDMEEVAVHVPITNVIKCESQEFPKDLISKNDEKNLAMCLATPEEAIEGNLTTCMTKERELNERFYRLFQAIRRKKNNKNIYDKVEGTSDK